MKKDTKTANATTMYTAIFYLLKFLLKIINKNKTALVSPASPIPTMTPAWVLLTSTVRIFKLWLNQSSGLPNFWGAWPVIRTQEPGNQNNAGFPLSPY
jgi:hypothetical protein